MPAFAHGRVGGPPASGGPGLHREQLPRDVPDLPPLTLTKVSAWAVQTRTLPDFRDRARALRARDQDPRDASASVDYKHPTRPPTDPPFILARLPGSVASQVSEKTVKCPACKSELVAELYPMLRPKASWKCINCERSLVWLRDGRLHLPVGDELVSDAELLQAIAGIANGASENESG